METIKIKKELLSIMQLSTKQIYTLIDTASSMKSIFTRSVKKIPALRGKTIVHLFYESSTRTKTSFEIAAKRLSADVIDISHQTSSSQKGESLLNTLKTLEAMKIDLIVLRHPCSGAAHFLSKHSNIPIVNAGDGTHEHPSQALLDVFTIKEQKKDFNNLNVLIVGDILHSRVFRSNIIALKKLGANVSVAGPPSLIPNYIKKLGCQIYYHIEKALPQTDIIYCLRIQKERQQQHYFPSLNEYSKFFRIDEKRLKLAKPNALLMHPGPINQNIEISSELAYGIQSQIQTQVTNGIAMRMAILAYCLGEN